MSKIPFDPNEEGGLELARAVVLERLRTDSSWRQYDLTGEGFDGFVEYIGDRSPGRQKLASLAQDVLWELTIQGIIAPGLNTSNPNFPWFRLTDYGKKVVSAGEFLPHDPSGYLERFRQRIMNPDPTVESYLSESLNCFTRGSLIASVVMLGIASERAFLILCEALLKALSNTSEKSQFTKILKANAIKPKQDWVLKRIEVIQSKTPRPLPDNVNIMLTVTFDFIRCQRNTLGHPQEKPPRVVREDAYVNLRIFPGYYEMLTRVIDYLGKNTI